MRCPLLFALVCALTLPTYAVAQFETGPAVPTTGYGYGSTSAAIADFNRDGKLDFAMADFNLQIFLAGCGKIWFGACFDICFSSFVSRRV